MEEQNAVVTRKSSECRKPGGSGTQRSERDAACPSSTQLAKEFSKLFGSEKNPTVEIDVAALVSLLLLYVCLRGETLSGDRVALAFYAAQDRAEKLGVDPDTFNDMAKLVETYGGGLAKKNPMSSMF